MLWKLCVFVLIVLAQVARSDPVDVCSDNLGRYVKHCAAEEFVVALAEAKAGGGGGGGSCTCPTFDEAVLCPGDTAIRQPGDLLEWLSDGQGGGCYHTAPKPTEAGSILCPGEEATRQAGDLLEWFSDGQGGGCYLTVPKVPTCSPRISFTPVFLDGTGALVGAVHHATYQVCNGFVSYDLNLKMNIQQSQETEIFMQVPFGLAGPLPPTIAGPGNNQEVALGSGVGMSSDGLGGWFEAKAVGLLRSQCTASGIAPINADRITLVGKNGGVTNQEVSMAIDGTYEILGSTLCV